jgi:beta-aspartyl-peptidase (threonine type)
MATSPVIIGSERSEAGLALGMDILRRGGSAIDAVEATIRKCEDNLDDVFLGTGGLPNAQGVVELDASIMVGSTRAFGAVGAIKNYPNPISIARRVMEVLPQHCLLVGEGAELFAHEQGFETAELLTEDARRRYVEGLRPSPMSLEGENTAASDGDELYRLTALALVERLGPPQGMYGTVNIIALDQYGEMVTGVSTSGYPWKYPGRVGDSSLPGCGNYADVRYGAAACTGRGELSMRVGGARSVVENLRSGMSPLDACLAMLQDAQTVPDPFRAELRTLCLTPDGRHAAASGQATATYNVMTASSTDVERHARTICR